MNEIRPGVWRAWRPRVGDSRPSQTFRGERAREMAEAWARGAVEPAVLLLGHWLDRWLALSAPTLARNTVLIYRRDVLACAPLAHRPLATISVAEWQALTNELLARWSRHHVAVWRGNISTALNGAVPAHLAENPMARVRLPRAEEPIPKAWRQDEVDRLLTAAEGGLHETWLHFMLGTGVRLGEARALLWEDLSFEAMTAVIRRSADNQDGRIGPTKNRRVRKVDIAEEAMPSLAEHAKRQKPGTALVFDHGGRPYGSKAFRDWLRTICRNAHVRSLPPHALRHTYASLALDAGVPVQDVAKQLGHTVATLQRIYAHFIGDDQRRAAKAIGKALRHRFSGPRANIGTRDRA